jgi:hypothetical protein
MLLSLNDGQRELPEETLVELVFRHSNMKAGPSSILSKKGVTVGFSGA